MAEEVQEQPEGWSKKLTMQKFYGTDRHTEKPFSEDLHQLHCRLLLPFSLEDIDSNFIILKGLDCCEFIFQVINRDKLLLLGIARMRQQTRQPQICFYCRSPF